MYEQAGTSKFASASLHIVFAILASVFLTIPKPAFALVGQNQLVSVSSGGQQANGSSLDQPPAISGDGRFVVFTSQASNLVSGDTNNIFDIFLRDRLLGTTKRVSIAQGGVEANGSSGSPRINYGGDFILFTSNATNLVNDDINSKSDLFLYTVSTESIERVSNKYGGGSSDGQITGSDIDASGRYITFSSTATDLINGPVSGNGDIFLTDRQTGETTLLSKSSSGLLGDRESDRPRISCDGRYIVFHSFATNLTPGPNNGYRDVFLADRTDPNAIKNISLNGVGGASEYPAISCDGNFITFHSGANNLTSTNFNGVLSILRFNRATEAITLESLTTSGAQVARPSRYPDISGDGSKITFMSDDLAYDPAHTTSVDNIFIRDVNNHTTELVSKGPDGQGGNFVSLPPSIDADGKNVVYASRASNLVAGQLQNGTFDTFVNSLMFDQTPPSVSANLLGVASQHGWYKADVTIDWMATDPPQSSGMPTDPPDTNASIEGENVSYTSAPSCDPMGNCATGIATVSLDKTAPTIIADITPVANGDGWHNSDVTITYSCVDGLSGIDTCPAAETISTEGGSQHITRSATDRAGNSGSVDVALNIDKTNPNIYTQVSPLLNMNGWSNSDVTITYTCTDSLSGIKTCQSPQTITTEGASQIVNGSAVDNADNSVQVTTSISIDKTVPNVSSVTLSSSLLLFFQPVSITVPAADALSGIDISQGGEYYIDVDPGIGNGTPMAYSNGNLTATITDNPGSFQTHTVYVRAKDKAGNWSTVKSTNLTVIF